MKKRVLTLILIFSMILLMGFGGLTASAEDYATLNERNVSPRLTNCYKCEFDFIILDPDEAHVLVTYSALADVFTQAKLTVKIQKKILGLFWNTVDIGTANDEWIAYSNAVFGEFYNNFSVDGTGTYRAVICLEVYGTSGVVDTIEDTLEFRYS